MGLLALTTAPAVAADGGRHDASGWTVPKCHTVAGDGSVTFTRDEGKRLVPTAQRLQPVAYTTALIALDQPDTLLAVSNNTLLTSGDAGCTWAAVGTVNGHFIQLTKAAGGAAYAWDLEGGALAIVTPTGVKPLVSPTAQIAGLGTDPDDPLHVRLVNSSGGVYDSRDGGRTWMKSGTPAGSLTAGYAAAFDPSDPDHIVLGGMTTGARVTFDGGRSWTASDGLSQVKGGKVNAFSLAVSPTTPDVVWAMGLDIAEMDSGAASQGRHIYRSTDGGLTFAPVVDQSPSVILQNGPVLVPHPSDPNVAYFVYGTYFQQFGTDIYRYDAGKGTVATTHNSNDRVMSIAFNPAGDSVMYLGLAEEG
ncbi:dispase autolysis-inducing protein [Streptomyces sp. NPDC047085]|uniref:WD40/YVTN/BNR-like repeat-containing protein n=1 Tax=Streptomyces sp. NPDC047085 TaxID=3155140 RepID=UPI0034058800